VSAVETIRDADAPGVNAEDGVLYQIGISYFQIESMSRSAAGVTNGRFTQYGV
jgi:hypothetical protein